ncbi:MAG: hypothetical protein R2848_08050 [Thermomicrobiales bacterium]
MIDLGARVPMLAVSALAVAFHGNMPSGASNALYVGAALCIAAVIGLVVIWFIRDHIETRLPLRFRNQWQALQESVFVNLRRPLVPAVLSALIWSMESSRVFRRQSPRRTHLVPARDLRGTDGRVVDDVALHPGRARVVEVATVVLKLVDVPVDLAGSVALLDRLITYWGLIAVGALSSICTCSSVEPESGPTPNALEISGL